MTLMEDPSHPGEVLAELYLEPLGMSVIELASRLHVPRTRIERLVKGRTALTVDTAIRLGGRILLAVGFQDKYADSSQTSETSEARTGHAGCPLHQ